MFPQQLGGLFDGPLLRFAIEDGVHVGAIWFFSSILNGEKSLGALRVFCW